MIIVVTGVPGSGKTLYAIDWVRNLSTKDNRPVYYSGIADLKLPWFEHDPTKWAELPPGAIMVIDECQRVFRPRANGSAVPSYIEAMETHRHKGVDLVLITQHPMLIDQNIRRLCGLHFHVHRIFGMHAATIMEWPQIKENCDKANKDADKRKWKYPKDVFELYKSAEVHTHKMRLPSYVWVLLVALVLVLGLAYRIYVRKIEPYQQAGHQPADAASSPFLGGQQPVRNAEVLTPAQYVKQFEPRVAGLAYTAAAYDKVTQPVRAPYPAACVQSKTRCQCYTQQGTRLETSAELCKGISEGGFFMAWDEHTGQMQPQALQPVKSVVDPAPLPGYVDLTPGHAVKGTQVASVDQAQQDGAGVRAARAKGPQ